MLSKQLRLALAVDTRYCTDMDRIAYMIAIGFGAGKLPKAPGTWGSILGLALAWSLASMPQYIALGVLVLSIALAIWSAERAAQLLQDKDPSCVVSDEIVGCALGLIWVPWSWGTALVGFALFRVFDIWKPWPVSWAERLPGGLGIVADDLVAGVYAATCLLGYQWII